MCLGKLTRARDPRGLVLFSAPTGAKTLKKVGMSQKTSSLTGPDRPGTLIHRIVDNQLLGILVTLLDITRRLTDQDRELTIYAQRPWQRDSSAILVHEKTDGTIPEVASSCGLAYFLEVFLACDFVDGWLHSLPHPPSAEETCDRLIGYAENDA